ncbi:single-stranded DNA-binding protein (plasmid) [Moraxella osloensis]
MKGINKAIILGNLGTDPQQVTFQDGGMIANLSIATSENWTDRNGNPQESTQWHKVRLSGKLAELGMRLLAKGSQVYVEGPIKTRKWVDKNNQTQYTTEIYAEKMEIITSAKQNNDAQAPNDSLIPFSSNTSQMTKTNNLNRSNNQISNGLDNDSNDPNWIPF